MKDKQPDYKKSLNDPYDLNKYSAKRGKSLRVIGSNPYDLSQSTSVSTNKRVKK